MSEPPLDRPLHGAQILVVEDVSVPCTSLLNSRLPKRYRSQTPYASGCETRDAFQPKIPPTTTIATAINQYDGSGA